MKKKEFKVLLMDFKRENYEAYDVLPYFRNVWRGHKFNRDKDYGDYSDYKNWIKLANMFLQNHRMVTTEFNGKVETQKMYEWWDVRVRMGGVTFEKIYSTEDGYMRGRSINQEYIKSVL